MFEFESAETEKSSSLRERIIDYLNASAVFSEPASQVTETPRFDMAGTLMDRIQNFIRFEFPDRWFTSQELRERYETVCDDIKLSTVSTYLSRLNRDGMIERRGNRNNRQYRLIEAPGMPVLEATADKRRVAEGRL